MPVVFDVVFTLAARAELIDAQDWYETEAPGFGRRLRAEVDAVIERMSANRSYTRTCAALFCAIFLTCCFSPLKAIRWS